MKTTIKVDAETANRLFQLKQSRSEGYDTVIRRLLDEDEAKIQCRMKGEKP